MKAIVTPNEDAQHVIITFPSGRIEVLSLEDAWALGYDLRCCVLDLKAAQRSHLDVHIATELGAIIRASGPKRHDQDAAI